MITTVISDFGGVLTSPLSEGFAAVGDQLDVRPEALGSAMAAISARDGANPLYELECGRMTADRFHELLHEQLAADLGRDVDIHSFPERYFGALSANDAMLDELARVRDEGYRIGLLTNNVREWEPRWRAMLPVDELFSVVVDSAFVGLRKPDPAIYVLTCSRLGVDPDECFFIDDFQHNCQAAAALGMAAVWFQDASVAIAELRSILAARGRPPLLRARAWPAPGPGRSQPWD